jgi:hypothetical protein
MYFHIQSDRLRGAAGEFATLSDRCEQELADLCSGGEELIGAVTHPSVSGALATALGAVEQHLSLVGLGLDHCDAGLRASADTYDVSDEDATLRIERLTGAR